MPVFTVIGLLVVAGFGFIFLPRVALVVSLGIIARYAGVLSGIGWLLIIPLIAVGILGFIVDIRIHCRYY